MEKKRSPLVQFKKEVDLSVSLCPWLSAGRMLKDLEIVHLNALHCDAFLPEWGLTHLELSLCWVVWNIWQWFTFTLGCIIPSCESGFTVSIPNLLILEQIQVHCIYLPMGYHRSRYNILIPSSRFTYTITGL